MPAHFADSPQMEAIYKMLSVTQPPPTPEAITKLYRPASVVDKAHIHGRCGLTLYKEYIEKENQILEEIYDKTLFEHIWLNHFPFLTYSLF